MIQSKPYSQGGAAEEIYSCTKLVPGSLQLLQDFTTSQIKEYHWRTSWDIQSL